MPSADCLKRWACRATYYRYRNAPEAVDPDIELRNAIQLIALEFPDYGYRRLPAHVKRAGWLANHKHVRRVYRARRLHLRVKLPSEVEKTASCKESSPTRGTCGPA